MPENFRKTIVLDGLARTVGSYFSDGLKLEKVEVDLSGTDALALHSVRERMLATSKVEGLMIEETKVTGRGLDGLLIAECPTEATIAITRFNYRWTAISPRGQIAFSIKPEEIKEYLLAAELLPAPSDRDFPAPEDQADKVDHLVREHAHLTGTNIDDEDLETVAGDMVGAVAHWVVRQGGSREDAINAIASGISHFLSEEFDRDQAWLEFDLDLRMSAPKAGIDVTYATGERATVEIDEDAYQAYLATGGTEEPAPALPRP